MVDTGRRMGKKVVALITDMDQPLGRAAGHSSEIIECIEVLNGRGPADLRELSIELSAWMFYLGERTESLVEGRRLAEAMIANGQALEKFKQGIKLQGGDERVIDEPQRLPQARSHVDVLSESDGYVSGTNCEALRHRAGHAGRRPREKGRRHRPRRRAGISQAHRRRVKKGESLATIHYNADAKLREAKDMIAGSYLIAPRTTAREAPADPPRSSANRSEATASNR